MKDVRLRNNSQGLAGERQSKKGFLAIIACVLFVVVEFLLMWKRATAAMHTKELAYLELQLCGEV